MPMELVVTICLVPLTVRPHFGFLFSVFRFRNPDVTVPKVGQQRAEVVRRTGGPLLQEDVVGLEILVNPEKIDQQDGKQSAGCCGSPTLGIHLRRHYLAQYDALRAGP